MEWLNSYGAKCVRVNGDTIVDSRNFSINITSDDPNIQIGEKQSLDISKISVVWFRRWSDRTFLEKYFSTENSISHIPYYFIENVNLDHHMIRNFLFSKFMDKPFISNPAAFRGFGKFIVLNKAKEAGFSVPETIVCNTKNVLINFLKKKGKIITKDIETSSFVKIGENYYSNYTISLDESSLANIPDNFSLSAFQEKIDKEYEIRAFYFFGEIYSMAIFSQNDPQTETDFRRYNRLKPNRNVPYLLPVEERKKVNLLMTKLSLKTGSLDIIKSKTGKYYFLEVNPVGQFTMVSIPCNYHLEKVVAKSLIKYGKRKRIS